MEGTFTVVCIQCDRPMSLGLFGTWHCHNCHPENCAQHSRPTLYDWTQEKDTNG